MIHKRGICFLLALLGLSVPLHATALFTMGPGPVNPGNNLFGMDSGSFASVASDGLVGNGSIRFGGGIVAANGLLYAIGSDSNSNYALYSFHFDGTGLATVGTLGNMLGWLGLTFDSANGNFYGVADNGMGMGLYQVSGAGATFVKSISEAPASMCGNAVDPYSGLAYDFSEGSFYGIALDACGVNAGGDRLFKTTLAAGTPSFVMDLGGVSNTHQGGLGYGGSNSFFDIFVDVNSGNGDLQRINLGNLSTTFLYDTGVQGLQNNGVAVAVGVVAPEPAISVLFGTGLALIGVLLWRRQKSASTPSQSCGPHGTSGIRVA
jgi:hypothetical protein